MGSRGRLGGLRTSLLQNGLLPATEPFGSGDLLLAQSSQPPSDRHTHAQGGDEGLLIRRRKRRRRGDVSVSVPMVEVNKAEEAASRLSIREKRFRQRELIKLIKQGYD